MQVALDAEGDGLGGVERHLVQQVGVGVVLQRIRSGIDHIAGIEILVGAAPEWVAWARV